MGCQLGADLPDQPDHIFCRFGIVDRMPYWASWYQGERIRPRRVRASAYAAAPVCAAREPFPE